MECFQNTTSPDGAAWKPLKRPRPGSKGGDIPLNDTGALRESVTTVGAKGNINDVGPRRVEIGTNLESSPIHNFGDGAGGDYLLTPKQAKYLAIPATVEAKNKGSPRNWGEKELEFRFGPVGGVAMKRGDEIIQYYFTKSVLIPARPFLGIGEDQAKEIEEETADYVEREIEKRLTDLATGGA